MATPQPRESGMTGATVAAPADRTAALPVAVFGRIFERGPFHRLVALFGGTRERGTVRAALGLALMAWLPLLLLAAGSSGGAGTPARALLGDYGALARYLIALPLLVAADILVGTRLTGIARYFVESGLVPEEAADRFEALLASTRAWCASAWAAVFIAAGAYLLAAPRFNKRGADRSVPRLASGPGGSGDEPGRLVAPCRQHAAVLLLRRRLAVARARLGAFPPACGPDAAASRRCAPRSRGGAQVRRLLGP